MDAYYTEPKRHRLDTRVAQQAGALCQLSCALVWCFVGLATEAVTAGITFYSYFECRLFAGRYVLLTHTRTHTAAHMQDFGIRMVVVSNVTAADAGVTVGDQYEWDEVRHSFCPLSSLSGSCCQWRTDGASVEHQHQLCVSLGLDQTGSPAAAPQSDYAPRRGSRWLMTDDDMKRRWAPQVWQSWPDIDLKNGTIELSSLAYFPGAELLPAEMDHEIH